jgi:hypothetical protein
MVEFAFVLLAGWFAAFAYVTGDAETAAHVGSWAALFVLGTSWLRRDRLRQLPDRAAGCENRNQHLAVASAGSRPLLGRVSLLFVR